MINASALVRAHAERRLITVTDRYQPQRDTRCSRVRFSATLVRSADCLLNCGWRSKLIVISTRRTETVAGRLTRTRRHGVGVQRLARLVRGSKQDGNDNDRADGVEEEEGGGVAGASHRSSRDNSRSCDNCGNIGVWLRGG